MTHFRFITFVFLVIFPSLVFSQNMVWYGISYDKPAGELNWVYEGGFGHRAGYTIIDDDRELGAFIGFDRFQPKQDTFYYVSGNDYGIALFSNYTLLQLCVNFQKSFCETKRINPFIGLDFGYYYYAFDYEEHEPGRDTEGSIIEGRGALCPMIGISSTFMDRWRVSLQSRFNFYISLGSSDSRDINYNSNVGRSSHFWSVGLVVGYLHNKE